MVAMLTVSPLVKVQPTPEQLEEAEVQLKRHAKDRLTLALSIERRDVKSAKAVLKAVPGSYKLVNEEATIPGQSPPTGWDKVVPQSPLTRATSDGLHEIVEALLDADPPADVLAGTPIFNAAFSGACPKPQRNAAQRTHPPQPVQSHANNVMLSLFGQG